LFDRQVSFFFSFNFSSILKIFSPFFSFNFHVFDNNYDVVFSPPPSIFRTPRRLVLRAILKRSERRRIFKKCDSIRVIFAKKQNKKDGNFSYFFLSKLSTHGNSHGVWCMLFSFKYIVPSFLITIFGK
jgi:hypothetical protein